MRQSEIFGAAKFVSAGKPCVSPVFFDKFTVNKAESTEITVTGLGFFYLFINGKRVGEDIFAPVTSFYHEYDKLACKVLYDEKMNSRIYAEKYDISDYVAGGENTVAVFTGPGWYANYSDRCVACFRIVNGENEFVSSENTKWFGGPLTEYRFTKGEKQDFTLSDFSKVDEAALMPCVIAELPETEYFIADCPNDKVIRKISPRKISTANGLDIYDAGENITGTVVFTCPESGKEIEIKVSEWLDESGNLSEKNHHGQQASFICDGSGREYRLLFTWHAFRFFSISAGAENIRCDVIHSDVKQTSEFKCENKVLNWLYEAYIRTQLCNMHAGIPSDCPHLERRGYTGDGQLTCEAAMLNIDSEKFYRKWIEDISDCQDIKSGHIQYTAPYVHSGGGPGGWGCAIAEVPYVFYKMFSDIEPFKANFDKMLHYFDYLEAHSENDLVVSDQGDEWCLGDWCTPHTVHAARPEIPEPFVNNYFYIRTIDRMVELCELIGRGEEKEKLLKIRSIKAEALIKNYFNPETGDFAGNLNSANAFAVDIGLGDERTLANLVEHIRNDKLDTGIFGTDLVVKTLCENGFVSEAFSFLAREEYPSFGFMMNSGATTLWEEWNEPRSMSHPMFGSAVKYLFFCLLGIKQEKGSTAFEKITVSPFANELTGDVAGSIVTKSGKIEVSVKKDMSTCFVKAPKNIELTVVFPGKAETVRY